MTKKRQLGKFYALMTLALIVLLGTCFSGHAFAQKEEDELEAFSYVDPEEMLAPVNSEDYVPTTLDNLSKLYWALAQLDINNDEAIDYYLMINECDLYTQFYFNDLDWHNIREASRREIFRRLPEFKRTFDVLIPLELGRYNTEKEYFEVEPESMIDSKTRFQIETSRYDAAICGYDREIPNYPRNLELVVSRPFSLRKVPVSRDLADEYLKMVSLKYEGIGQTRRLRYYTRMAYMRVKFSVMSYRGMSRGNTGGLMASVFGRIDGLEFYADEEKKFLLHEEDRRNY
ncbi:MAG: DUF4852 domain-containing protein [Rhodospirillales bacterium]|nr:DUF4852 domain-containing protein [Rhodospirillales bacterium]